MKPNQNTFAMEKEVDRQLLKILRAGVPSQGRDGEIYIQPASPAYFLVALRRLKDCGCVGVAKDGSPLGSLKEVLRERGWKFSGLSPEPPEAINEPVGDTNDTAP